MKRFVIAALLGLFAGSVFGQLNPTQPDLRKVTRAVVEIQKGNSGPDQIQKLRVAGDASIGGSITSGSLSVPNSTFSNVTILGTFNVTGVAIIVRSTNSNFVEIKAFGSAYSNMPYIRFGNGMQIVPHYSSNWIGHRVGTAWHPIFDSYNASYFNVVTGFTGSSSVTGSIASSQITLQTVGVTSNAPASGITNFVIQNGLITDIQR